MNILYHLLSYLLLICYSLYLDLISILLSLLYESFLLHLKFEYVLCQFFDRLVVWITQTSYAQNEIEDQIAMYEDDAETDKFDDMIDAAEEGLIAYRKLHPDAIAFFTKTDWNKITLKYCPYHLFQELILHKTALIKN